MKIISSIFCSGSSCSSNRNSSVSKKIDDFDPLSLEIILYVSIFHKPIYCSNVDLCDRLLIIKNICM